MTEASRLSGYSLNTLDRGEVRDAESSVRALGEAPARLYLFVGDRIVFDGAEPLFAREAAEALAADLGSAILLGRLNGAARLAAQVPPESVDAVGLATTDLRSLAVEGRLAPEHLGALAQAKSVLDWHARHRFCARCGTATAPTNGGARRDCPTCSAQHFPRVDPVVIMLALDGDRALLGRQARFAPGVYSALAGFVEPGETLEDAVRREVKEEAGVSLGAVRYHSSQPWPFPSSLMLGCHARALGTALAVDREELEDARWFSREELASMLDGSHPDGLICPPPMAIAHQLIRAFVERGEAVLQSPPPQAGKGP